MHESSVVVTPHWHVRENPPYYALSARPGGSNKAEHYQKVYSIEDVAIGLKQGLHLRMSAPGISANLRSPASIKINGTSVAAFRPWINEPPGGNAGLRPTAPMGGRIRTHPRSGTALHAESGGDTHV